VIPQFTLTRPAFPRREIMVAKQKIAGDFNRLISEGVTLVDFDARWCIPCRTQKPIVEALEKEFQGLAHIAILDVDRHAEIALRLAIQSIPTIVIFKDGIERKRFVGLQSGTKLSDALQSLLDGKRSYNYY
jgi:thioredoxin 1